MLLVASIVLSEVSYRCELFADEGEVLSWGHGGHGQLGHPTLQNHRVPLAIKALSEERIVYIACGGSTSAAISGESYGFFLVSCSVHCCCAGNSGRAVLSLTYFNSLFYQVNYGFKKR